MTEETVPLREMDDTEQAWADSLYAAIMDYSRHDERGQQSADYRVGISDLGFCSERTNRMLAQEPMADTDVLQAFLGTAIGDHVERAVKQHWPSAIIQPEVVVTLHGELHDYHVPGHPDIVLPEHGVLLDGKTVRGLQTVKRTGPSVQQQYQRHLYALGAYEGGMFPNSNLEDIQVGNVWLDRGGDEHQVHVQMEPYSPQIVTEAAWWLDEVTYAYIHSQPARKEPHFAVCERYCGFFADCRLGETDAEGLITDDVVLAAVDMHREAGELEKQARLLKDQAKSALAGVTGSTGEYAVRWVHVNGSHVEFDRKPSERLDVRRVK